MRSAIVWLNKDRAMVKGPLVSWTLSAMTDFHSPDAPKFIRAGWDAHMGEP